MTKVQVWIFFIATFVVGVIAGAFAIVVWTTNRIEMERHAYDAAVRRAIVADFYSEPIEPPDPKYLDTWQMLAAAGADFHARERDAEMLGRQMSSCYDELQRTKRLAYSPADPDRPLYDLADAVRPGLGDTLRQFRKGKP